MYLDDLAESRIWLKQNDFMSQTFATMLHIEASCGHVLGTH